MSSINFDEKMDQESFSLLKEMFGEPVAKDEKTALYDGLLEMKQKAMRDLARKAKQPVTVCIHSTGETIELSDGTVYEVTTSGGYWKRIKPVDE